MWKDEEVVVERKEQITNEQIVWKRRNTTSIKEMKIEDESIMNEKGNIS